VIKPTPSRYFRDSRVTTFLQADGVPHKEATFCRKLEKELAGKILTGYKWQLIRDPRRSLWWRLPAGQGGVSFYFGLVQVKRASTVGSAAHLNRRHGFNVGNTRARYLWAFRGYSTEQFTGSDVPSNEKDHPE